MKLKRGTVREDGMVFMNYKTNGKEWWATLEKYEELKNRDKKAHVDWRSENKDVVSQRNKSWREANPEKARENLRRWVSQNKERSNELKRNWRKNNPEKAKQEYQNKKRDIEKFRQSGRCRRAKRRALLLERLHPDHNQEIERVLIKQCQSLTKRLGIKFEIDHIVALSQGGWHHHLNLHIIPMSWNRRKHSKDNSVLPDCWKPEVRIVSR
jgi:ATP/maltotriose-dependent transcriptional regulator MalT